MCWEKFEIYREKSQWKIDILFIFYPIFQDHCHFIQIWKITAFFYNIFFGFGGWGLPPPPLRAPLNLLVWLTPKGTCIFYNVLMRNGCIKFRIFLLIFTESTFEFPFKGRIFFPCKIFCLIVRAYKRSCKRFFQIFAPNVLSSFIDIEKSNSSSEYFETMSGKRGSLKS